jgi:hypothetical protein
LYKSYADATTIIWYALIGWACSVPLQYLYGIFLTSIYDNTLKKYELKKMMKSSFSKDSK